MQRQLLRDLPENKRPKGTRCIQITIPDDDDWERDLWGQIYPLTRWNLWQRDIGKNGTIVAKQWLKAMDTWSHCEPTQQNGLTTDEENTMPAWRETCINGVYKLEVRVCACPEEWLTVSLEKGSSQPGGGANQPNSGGGKATYQGCLNASGQYLIPTGLSVGDTVDVQNLSGAWNDPDRDGPIWRCPDGQLFILGACAGGKVLEATDPLPTTSHMALLLKVGSTYYDASNGPITIASGSNQQGVLLANDAVPGNDNGSICFNVVVTNNQATAWRHILDFTMSPYGWGALYNPADPSVSTVWNVGTGWVGQPGIVYPNNNYCDVTVTFPACHIDFYELTYEIGTHVGGSGDLAVFVGGVPTSVSIDVTTGSPKVASNTFNMNNVTQLSFSLETYGSTPPGANFAFQARLSGTGPDPFPTAPTY